MNSRIQRPVIRVAIIGGGPSSISLTDNLLLCSDKIAGVRIEATIIDKLQRAVSGGPFGSCPRIHRCNQRSFSMATSPSKPREFRDWLEKKPNAKEMTNEDLTHPQRVEFGNFLTYKLDNLCDGYKDRGHKLESITGDVVNVSENQNSVVIQTSKRQQLEFDFVVLTNAPSVSDQYTELLGHENYHSSPYPTNDLAKKIPYNARVTFIGGSLTSVDGANGLAELGHLGPITLRSRSGRLPAVLSEGGRYNPAVFTPENIKKLLEMEQLPLPLLLSMAKEELERSTDFGKFDLDWMPRVNETPKEFLERSIHRSQIQQPYQSVLREVYLQCGEKIYRKLSTEDKSLAKSSALWRSYRHTMAPPTARAFLSLLMSGQATVIGGLKSIEPCDDGSFRISHQTGPKTTYHEADVVINCTGASANLPKLIEKGLADPLICSLVESGAVTAHPVGGLKAVPDRWNVIGRNGNPSSRIYATGNLLSGEVLYTSGMDAIARLTDQIAQALIENWLAILKGGEFSPKAGR